MLKDGRTTYGGISMLNHWVAALLLVAMLAIGLVHMGLPESDAASRVIFYHASLGLIVLPIVLWRIAWRARQGFPEPLPGPTYQQYLARATHILLLVILGLLVLTGPLYLWTEVEALPFFNLFFVPSPLGEWETVHEIVEWLHVNTALYGLTTLLGLHALGVLKRMLIDRDDPLHRNSRFARDE